MARPRINISIEALETLCILEPTIEEIAAYFNVSRDTIERRMKEKKYREARERGVNKGNVTLRQAQFKAARDGDRTMLIWLGKQRLGQKDERKIEQRIESHSTHAHFGLSESLALAEEATAPSNAVPLPQSGTG